MSTSAPKFPEGWRVFPLRSGTKTPTHKAWQDIATDDPEQIAAWAAAYPDCNWGCAMGPSGLSALDIDKGEIGENSLFEFELEHGDLPETREHRTARGGRHLIFSDPKRKLRNSVSKIGPKLDTRGGNGFVVMPPSTFEGGLYEVLAERSLAVVPECLVLSVGGHREPVAAPVDIPLDTSVNVGRAKWLLSNYIAQGHIAVQGAGGDDLTYAVCAEILNLGLSTDKAEEILQPWNDACQPPWNVDELRVKIENANSYAQNEAGAWAVPPASVCFPKEALDMFTFGSLTPLEAPAPDNKGVRSFRDVMARKVPALAEIIMDYVEKGIPTFLAGRGESFKSTVALQWSICIASGHLILGREPVPVAHVVIYASEDGPDEVDRRIQRIAKRLGVKEDLPITIVDRVGRDSALVEMCEGGNYELLPFWHELHARLKALPGHKFVVLDSCLDYVRFAGKAKIDEGAVNIFIKGLLQQICNNCDCTLLVIWHPSQAGQDRGDASGWSVAWHNAPRSRLSLTAVKDVEGAVELKVEKRSHGRKPKPVTLRWEQGCLLPLSDVAVADQMAALTDAVVRVALVAAEHGTPIQKQKNLEKWVTDDIEKAIGRRPTQREVKETLAAALPAKLLRYVSGNNNKCAGYYPFDQRKAEDLAEAAKFNNRPG